MQYHSTRSAEPLKSFEDILIEGLAADGGLMVPATYPQLSVADLSAWRKHTYAEVAFEIIQRFWPALPAPVLKTLLSAAYGQTFASPEVVTLKPLIPKCLYLLGLSEGPTLAFKDIAMQFLGQAFEYVLDKNNQVVNIVGATSGDTGSAAEYALRGRDRIAVFMLSPRGRMSAFQRAQMYSLQDPNIHNLTVEGTFDECQDLVKQLNQDAAFKTAHHISAVNSINWGRIVAQVVYYVWGWLRATQSDDQQVSFTVPSGNFGNVLAGHIARQMGVPIQQLVVATNENDVLDVFFKTGVYRPRSPAKTYLTSSPSMDISKASNFERFVFDLVDRKPDVLAHLWQRLATDGEINLSDTPAFAKIAEFGLTSGRSTHADRVATIAHTYQNFGVIIDPHTADGLHIAQQYLRRTGTAESDVKPRVEIEPVPMLVLETALPIKFSEVVCEAIGQAPPRPPAFVGLEALPQRTQAIETTVQALREQIIALGLH